MAETRTEIQVEDKSSVVFRNITASVNACMGAVYSMQDASSNAFDTTSLVTAGSTLGAMSGQMQKMASLAFQVSTEEVRIERSASQAAASVGEAGVQQEELNNSAGEGTGLFGQMADKVKSVMGDILSLQSVGQILGLSDELALTQAGLSRMNDGMQTTGQLQDRIYQSAQSSRGSYMDMADSVANLGALTGNAFSSSAQIVGFTEQMNKMLKLSGVSTEEAGASMMQLAQFMQDGVVGGDELTSVLESTPMMASALADYLGVSTGELEGLASQGAITSQILANAVTGAAGSTDVAFAALPVTWGDIWMQFKNSAMQAFGPVLEKINEIANSEGFATFVQGLSGAMQIVGLAAAGVMGLIMNVGSFMAENWGTIGPIIFGVAAAFALYTGIMAAYNIIQGISNGLKMLGVLWSVMHGTSTVAEGAATTGAAAAQMSFNAALLSCPLVWIILLIIAAVAILTLLCSHFLNTGNTATTAFGMVTGAINVAIAFFKNLGMMAANVGIGIGMAIAACAINIKVAFQNAIKNVQSFWYSLLSTVMVVIAGICEQLNRLPFIEFDYSGISSKAEEYADKAKKLKSEKEDYVDVGAAFDAGMSTFDAFGEGWAQNAYDEGAAWGDDKWNGLFGSEEGAAPDEPAGIPGLEDIPGMDGIPEGTGMPPQSNYAPSGGGGYGGIADSSAATAANTESIADSMEITSQDLKYLRDLAEREAVNRFTTAEISVEVPISAYVGGNMDIDGIVDHLANSVQLAMENTAEGVHY